MLHFNFTCCRQLSFGKFRSRGGSFYRTDTHMASKYHAAAPRAFAHANRHIGSECLRASGHRHRVDAHRVADSDRPAAAGHRYPHASSRLNGHVHAHGHGDHPARRDADGLHFPYPTDALINLALRMYRPRPNKHKLLGPD